MMSNPIFIKNPEKKGFISKATVNLPIPKYCLTYKDEERYPIWTTSEKELKAAKNQFCYYNKKVTLKSRYLKRKEASKDFQEYYLKIREIRAEQCFGKQKGTAWKTENPEYRHKEDWQTSFWGNKLLITCQHCGKVFPLTLKDIPKTEEMEPIINDYGEDAISVILLLDMFDVSEIKRCECASCHKRISNPILVQSKHISPKSLHIFDNGDRLSVSCFFNSFYVNKRAEKLSMEAFRIRVVFNTKTGQTYILPSKTLDGKLTKHTTYQHIVNISYKGCINSGDIVKKMFKPIAFRKAIITSLLKKHNKEEQLDQWIELFRKHKNNLDQQILLLTLFNRFPMFNIEMLEELSEKMGSIYMDTSNVFHKITPATTLQEVPMLIDVNLPKTKTFRRLISQSIINAIKLKTFASFGFKKVDLMQRFCEIENETISLNKSETYWEFWDDYSTRKEKAMFVRKLIKERGDIAALKLISTDTAHYWITDTAVMYAKLKPHNILTKNDFKGNLKEIHDNFSKLLTRIKFKNTPIKYSQKEKDAYNHTIDGLSFCLAKDTHELIRVGQDMHICVGGYGDKAVSKSCTIIIAYEQGKPVICIEINTGKKLVQAKSLFNNLVQGHHAVALKKWVEKVNVSSNSCYDFKHIEENKIEFDENKMYNLKHDYHILEIDGNGDVMYANR